MIRGSPEVKAYLDIETSFLGDITVIGLYAEDRGFVQLVGGSISDLAVWRALEGIEVICTYNGTRFDLPVIRRRLAL
ncbi:MAG: ribonuclease H-like domain-containing protein, partial [Candidatus Methylomirabilales bacterium]